MMHIDRRVVEELRRAGWDLIRYTGSHAVFSNDRGQIISCSKSPKDRDTQLREVRRDIRRYQNGTYK